MSHGKIMLVGIGPGSAEHMTARARAAIVEADTVIGYVTYIKLVADLLDGKEIIRKSMTEELDRAIEALARAREGKKVALISSGDAGVYGMGGPTFEVLMQAGWTPPEVTVETDEAGNEQRIVGDGIEVEIIPGASMISVRSRSRTCSRRGPPLPVVWMRRQRRTSWWHSTTPRAGGVPGRSSRRSSFSCGIGIRRRRWPSSRVLTAVARTSCLPRWQRWPRPTSACCPRY